MDRAESPPPAQPSAGADTPVAEVAGRRSGAAVPVVLAGLAVGLGLRVVAAWRLGSAAFEWEADGFATWFEGWSWGDWNRARPPGSQAILAGLGHAGGLTDVGTIRIALALMTGLVSWLAAAAVVASLGTGLPARHRSLARGLRWMTWLWALLPTLVAVAPHPVPDAWSGAGACLVLAAVAFTRRSPGTLGWGLVALAASAWLLVGGVLAALVLLASLLVYLIPVPRFSEAAPPVLALALAGAVFWFVQRGPDPERAWLPDTGPAWSLAALVDQPLHLEATPIVDHDRRAGNLYADALRRLGDHGVVDGCARIGRRLAIDALNPRRFEELRPDEWSGTRDQAHPPGLLALGLLDGLLRGGACLFACAALLLWPRGRSSSLPRGALAAGIVLLPVLGTLLSTGPWSLAPFDLVLVALAGAAVSGADPAAATQRRRAFALSGLVFVMVPVAVWIKGWPISDWNRHLVNELGQGRALVAQLDGDGPRSPWEEHALSLYEMDPGAPFQRLPEAALRHAEQAVAGQPTDEGLLGTLVSAMVENLRLDEAERIALSVSGADGQPTPRGRVLLQFVAESRRRLATEPHR